MSPRHDVERPGRGDDPRSGPVNQNADGGRLKGTVADRSAWPVPVGDFMAYAWVVEPVEPVEDEPAPTFKVRRRSLPGTHEDLSWRLLRLVQALARLRGDDRYPRYRQAVAQRNLPRLSRAAAELLDLLDDLRADRAGSS